MPKPVLYKILFFTSVSFLVPPKKDRIASFFHMQLFPVQKHVVTFALFYFYLIFWSIHHLFGLQNPHVYNILFSGDSLQTSMRHPFSCQGISVHLIYTNVESIVPLLTLTFFVTSLIITLNWHFVFTSLFYRLQWTNWTWGQWCFWC